MMYPELYQYFLLHKQLPVPGIGTFLVERKPAQIDFPNKQLLPPVYTIAMKASAPVPSGTFFNWLGSALGISQMDAVIRFNDFVFDLNKQVEKGHTVNWSGVGIIKKGLAGEIKFMPHEIEVKEQPVPAVKVLRGKAEHSVRVGEEERTSLEMEVMLAKPDEKKSHWWALALILGLLAIIFIGWYFSQHGVEVSSAANNQPLTPAEAATATYKELR